MKRRWFGFFVVTLLVTSGCATTPAVSSSGQNPPPGYTGPVAQRPEWKTGDAWDFEFVRGSEKRMTYATWTVVEVKDKEVLVRSSDGSVRHYNPDLNWFKTTREGNIVDKVDPEVRWLGWPLWVGKKWTLQASGTYDTLETFKVVAIEKVKVLGGEFEAFAIDREVELTSIPDPQKRKAYDKWRVWYAPAVKNVVKLEADTYVYGPLTWTLIRYTPSPFSPGSR